MDSLLEFLLEGPQTKLRTLSQNCELTLQKLRTNRIMNKRGVSEHCRTTFSKIWRGVARESRYTLCQNGPVAPTFSALRGGVALRVASWKVSRYRGVSQLHCRLLRCNEALRFPYFTAYDSSKAFFPRSHKPTPLEGRFGNCKIAGCKETRQPFANLFCQPFAKLFCQPLSRLLFLWTPGARLETQVNGFLVLFNACMFKTHRHAVDRCCQEFGKRLMEGARRITCDLRGGGSGFYGMFSPPVSFPPPFAYFASPPETFCECFFRVCLGIFA